MLSRLAAPATTLRQNRSVRATDSWGHAVRPLFLEVVPGAKYGLFRIGANPLPKPLDFFVGRARGMGRATKDEEHGAPNRGKLLADRLGLPGFCHREVGEECPVEVGGSTS